MCILSSRKLCPPSDEISPRRKNYLYHCLLSSFTNVLHNAAVQLEAGVQNIKLTSLAFQLELIFLKKSHMNPYLHSRFIIPRAMLRRTALDITEIEEHI